MVTGWFDMVAVAAVIGAAVGYLFVRWLRARRRAGESCAGGCGCAFAAKSKEGNNGGDQR